MDRLQPMREDFQHMVEQVVAQSPKVCVVQHLEALTAKEESLLLLLGHTQLGGGRQFAPHADRLLAVELVETDGLLHLIGTESHGSTPFPHPGFDEEILPDRRRT